MNQTAIEYALLLTFFCPATESVRVRQETGLLSYRYQYAGNWTNISPEPWMGAYHSSELPLLMGTHPDVSFPPSYKSILANAL
jgi:cholinesterase